MKKITKNLRQLRELYRSTTSRAIPAGVVLYTGPSLIDGITPIVVVATGLDRSTTNEKTGPMIQTWIMRADIPPHRAVYAGLDAPICGGCPFAGGNGCYVITAFGPRAVWGAWKNGVYETYNPDRHDILFAETGLRIGSYGDPTAAPFKMWKHLADLAPMHAGYTHSWKIGRFWRFRSLIMASTHSETENQLAQSRGWRTFRAKRDDEPAAADEIVCPASAEAGYTKDCASCGACNGNRNQGARRSVVINIHGSRSTIALAKRALPVLA